MEDTERCGAMPCDYPTEAGSTKCGCPEGYDWVDLVSDCVPREASCGVPPSDCDVNPYQVGCLNTYSPWDPVQGCCYFDTYGGEKDYAWSDITTY